MFRNVQLKVKQTIGQDPLLSDQDGSPLPPAGIDGGVVRDASMGSWPYRRRGLSTPLSPATADSGPSSVKCRPCGAYSRCGVASPPSALFSSVWPKPLRSGAVTRGPPLSCQLNENLGFSSRSSTDQRMAICPPGAGSAPNLTALAAGSWV